LNANERLVTGAIRELREETRIKVPEAVLKGSLKYEMNFDHPDRSLRGRTITTAFLFQLPDFVHDGKISLPEVKGSDDAEKAMWVPLDTALNSPEMFFEDHFDIIDTLIGKL
jgi:bifunctional NMN adenylyltransferase/nudix hydrolase